MSRGKKRLKKMTEYEKFKEKEPEYIDSVTKREGKGVRKKDLIGWLVALLLVSTSIYFVVDYMVDSRQEVTEIGKLDKLSAVESVEQMFDENLEWIRTDLTQEEYDQVFKKVNDLADSSEKAKIKSLLKEAGAQLESKLAGQSLVDGLKTTNGEVNVDLDAKDLLDTLDDFPSNYNPDFVEELKKEYLATKKVIDKAIELEDRIKELAVEMDTYLDKGELDSLNADVEALPFSDRKSQLSYDMKALYQDYEKQQEELERQRAEEERIRKEEEARLREEEALRQAERERQAEIERQEREQLEKDLERQRLREAEEKRILEETERYENQYNNSGNNNTNTETSTEVPQESESVETPVSDNTESDAPVNGSQGANTAPTQGDSEESSVGSE